MRSPEPALFVVAVLLANLQFRSSEVPDHETDTGGDYYGHHKGKHTPAPHPRPGVKKTGFPDPSGRTSQGPLTKWWSNCISDGKSKASRLDANSAIMDCCSGRYSCDCINKGCKDAHKDDPNCKIKEEDRCHVKCEKDFTLDSCNNIKQKTWLALNPWVWGIIGLGMILFVILVVYCLCYMRKIAPKIKGKNFVSQGGRSAGHFGGGGGGGSGNRRAGSSRSKRGISSAKRTSNSRRTSMGGKGRSMRRSMKVSNRQAAPPPPPPPLPEQSKKATMSANPKNPVTLYEF